MGLRKLNYIDKVTVIPAENLNAIQDAIIAMEDGLFTMEDIRKGDVITITDASNRAFRSFSIYGKTTQNGTPTPDVPVELVSVGNSGSITVNVNGDNKSQNMTVETPNGLPGIPVASGGNYTDANGQQWVCDEIDLARGVYIARTRKITFEGTEKISSQPLGGNYEYQRYHVNIGSQYAANIPNAKVYDGYCTHYGRISADSAYVGKGLNKTALQAEDVNFYVDFETTDAFRAYLVEQYAQGTPVEVQYILAAPIETPLTDAEISAYAALHTYKDYTEVSNDAVAWMELEYVMDAKKYIDSLVGARVLLWNNPHPSSFEAESVPLDLSGYDGIEVLFYEYDDNVDNAIISSGYIPLDFRYKSDGSVFPLYGQGTLARGIVTYYRCFYVNPTGIDFEVANAFDDGNSSLESSYIIPYRIYGIKNGA